LSSENFNIQIRKGLLEFCVLQIISKEEAFTSEIIKKLKNSKIIVAEGTIYPLLNRLKKLGYVKHNWRESRLGPPRKYYSVSYEGILHLKNLEISWKEIESSVKKLLKN
tara:strand:+ start:721 stop:1047 length:327 start_codon:yes stop_codon:yes gene_type:complete